jgi:hypothetical protein
MKLTPYKKAIAMTKEAINAVLVPVRATQTKKQAELEVCKIDEKILTLESEVQEITVEHPLDFDGLLKKLDEIALLERRKKQFGKVVEELFPEVPEE